MKNRKYFCVLIVPIIIGAVSAIVMLLWNALLPDLFGVSSISFWQALGLLILSKILFGGFGGGRRGKRFGPPQHFRRKWRQMNEEERQKLREEWKSRCKWRD